jgi:phosphoribosyl 1,2-cyclic phosphate phosphodiesterase
MPDQPFVINDRRKFTAEGDLRPDAAPSEPKPKRDDSPVESSAGPATEASAGPRLVHTADPGAPSSTGGPIDGQGGVPSDEEAQAPPPLTAEQTQQATSAYNATIDRLDTAIRASNPAMGPIPEMNFERLVHSIYMQTLLQLGLAGDPNSTPQVDLLGARSSIDMLGVIENNAHGLPRDHPGPRSPGRRLASATTGNSPRPEHRPLKMLATLTFLGSGTSMGVPTLGCHCAVCADAHKPSSLNRRTRPSIAISYGEPAHTVLIDTGPDFHHQAIRENINSVDAVLYTHSHADHILGMDDLRPLSFHRPDGITLYADDATASVIERVFEYTFRAVDRYPTSARVHIQRTSTAAGAAISLFGVDFIRVPVLHGRQTIAGYRFGSTAYLTDMSGIPPESLPLLQGLDILVLDALRREPHPTHSHLQQSIALVEKISPRRAFFTHISHGLDHETTNAALPAHIRLAHDGLKLEFEIA